MEFNKERESQFLRALADDDQEGIVELFPDQEFILIEVESDDADGDGDETNVTAMITEVEDFLALVLFTSTEMVDTFADNSDAFEGVESIPSFLMNGRQLMEMIPENMGLFLNPESDECFVMSPAVFASFRDDMSAS